MTRNITNLNLGNGRNIRNLPNTVSIIGEDPVEVVESDSNTKITVSLKGLSGFTADKIIKVNSAGDALEYADETDTQYTFTNPLLLSGTTVSLKGLSGFTANKIIKVNSAGDALEYADDTNTEYTLQSPLSFISTNKIQIQQSLFNVSTSLVDGDFVPIFDSNGNFDKISFLNLKTELGINAVVTSTTPLEITGTNIALNPSNFITQTAINNADLITFFDETNIVSNPFTKITFANFQNILLISGVNFGTQTATTGNRTFGNVNYVSTIFGTSVVVGAPLTLNGATTLNSNLEIYGNMKLSSTGNFSSNNRTITWEAFSGTVITAYLKYVGANESLVMCSRGGSGNLVFSTGSEEATRLTINDDDIIATNNISVVNTTSTSGVKLDLQFQNQNDGTHNYIQFGKTTSGTAGNMAKFKYFHHGDDSEFNFVALGLEQADLSDTNTIKIFSGGDIILNNTGTTLFNAISINNPATVDQWNTLQRYRFASSSTTTAFSIRVFDYQPTGTDYQYYGIFSNNNVGDGASPTCPFQIRNDGYIELKSNFTNNITSLSNLGVTGITIQLKYVGRTTYNSYHPLQQMVLASGAAWTRWNYSHTSGTDYGGISYSSGSSGNDCITWQDNGNFYITGIYSPSDKRIKKDVVDADLDECITVMKSIKLKKYKYTDAYQETYKTTKEEVYGFLADDIIDNEYLNYAGSDDGLPKDLKDGTQLENFKTIDKPKILTVLWGVCNKQQTEIELLKSEIANIKSHLNL